MLGRLDHTEDPDRGTTTLTYTPYGEKKTVTNEAGDTLAYVYDALGRTTSLRDDDVTGTMRAGWVYDTIHKGMPTSSTRYVGSDQWTNRVVDYDDNTGRPTGTEMVVPASEEAWPAPTASTRPTCPTAVPPPRRCRLRVGWPRKP